MISTDERALHERWLLELTQTPTAAGREFRVTRWVEAWAAQRPDVTLSRDAVGNLTLRLAPAPEPTDAPPLYFTAHTDHPAFVVERIVAPGLLHLAFRGGVLDAYFPGAKVAILSADDTRRRGVLAGKVDAPGPFTHYACEVDDASGLRVGDVGVWDLPPAEVIDGILHTHACDDLAALAGALAAFDVLRRVPSRADTRVLLTRAEEVGFVGAIGACRLGTIPAGARLIALENSRSFAESPIGGGPIVRVGDRISVFTPRLTDAVARRAEDLAKGSGGSWKWQRKLMAGGACEASVFCDAGFDATCVCLPLGNYHNMADLAAVQAGTHTAPPAIARECIALADYHNMVDLLVACAQSLPASGTHTARFAALYDERRFVLD
jgi:endoglucanase